MKITLSELRSLVDLEVETALKEIGLPSWLKKTGQVSVNNSDNEPMHKIQKQISDNELCVEKVKKKLPTLIHGFDFELLRHGIVATRNFGIYRWQITFSIEPKIYHPTDGKQDVDIWFAKKFWVQFYKNNSLQQHELIPIPDKLDEEKTDEMLEELRPLLLKMYNKILVSPRDPTPNPI